MGCGASANKKAKDNGAAAPAGTPVKVSIGPLEIDRDGVVVKPKFNVGITGPGIYLLAGVRDVRDGLAGETFAMMHKDYTTKGSSLTEILENVRAVDPVPVLDDLIKAVPEAISKVIEALGIDIGRNCVEVEGVVFFWVGVGVSAGLYLGWADTKGYSMIGVEGIAASLVSVGFSLYCGRHESGTTVRIVMWLADVGVDAVVRLKDPIKKDC